jgi:hypothetical protein
LKAEFASEGEPGNPNWCHARRSCVSEPKPDCSAARVTLAPEASAS